MQSASNTKDKISKCSRNSDPRESYYLLLVRVAHRRMAALSESGSFAGAPRQPIASVELDHALQDQTKDFNLT
jgi:hypothetical protein